MEFNQLFKTWNFKYHNKDFDHIWAASLPNEVPPEQVLFSILYIFCFYGKNKEEESLTGIIEWVNFHYQIHSSFKKDLLTIDQKIKQTSPEKICSGFVVRYQFSKFRIFSKNIKMEHWEVKGLDQNILFLSSLESDRIGYKTKAGKNVSIKLTQFSKVVQSRNIHNLIRFCQRNKVFTNNNPLALEIEVPCSNERDIYEYLKIIKDRASMKKLDPCF